MARVRAGLRVVVPARGRACLVAVLLCAVLLAACSSPQVRRRSFMSASGDQAPGVGPGGLNPLGRLEVCEPGLLPTPDAPVIAVSQPDRFTADASRMVRALREALARPPEALPVPQFTVTPGVVNGAEQARAVGRGCGALLVLWEPRAAGTLVLTLPEPDRIPIRPLVRETLCEYGSAGEQVNALHLTVLGVLAMQVNDYERAVFYQEQAHAIDERCLQLPGPGPAGAGDTGGPASP